MPSLHPVHGGTDSIPDPRYDFSSNANPLGPCPSVLAAVRNADVTRYPDPRYTRLRATLAAHHRTVPERIVVGAGASELILRLISRIEGAVQQLVPTFSEYARGARLAGRTLISARSAAAFLRAQSEHPGLGFICWPHNCDSSPRLRGVTLSEADGVANANPSAESKGLYIFPESVIHVCGRSFMQCKVPRPRIIREVLSPPVSASS